jgi:hypothetical protein
MGDPRADQSRERIRTLETALANLREAFQEIDNERALADAERSLREVLQPRRERLSDLDTRDDHDLTFIDHLMEWIARPWRDESPPDPASGP